jgi:hypothetical protein
VYVTSHQIAAAETFIPLILPETVNDLVMGKLFGFSAGEGR